MHVMSLTSSHTIKLARVMLSVTDLQLATLIVDGLEFAAKSARAKDDLAKMKEASSFRAVDDGRMSS